MDDRLSALHTTRKNIEKAYYQQANTLSAARQQAAISLSQKITERLHDLAMPHAELTIQCEQQAHLITPHGQDHIAFLISTNKGETQHPLSDIVSGGELSRISLALQVATLRHSEAPSLLFDEVDVGTGGQTAAIIGDLLRELSQSTQVFCITHLPQIAGRGHQHYQVSKHSDNHSTVSSIKALNKTERLQEMARMLGGKTITAKTKAHAKELLSIDQ